MRYTIKSRKFGRDIDFFASLPNSKNLAYVKVWLEGDGFGDNNCANNSRQICENGSLMGDTIRASKESFENDCRKWWKQYLRNR
jgi:hypothetical protein